MDGFSEYNQIHIKPEDQHKTAFIFRCGTFSYQKIPFNLWNVGATFQQVMTFTFHDLWKIIEVYLDNFASHSRMRVPHPYHLCLVFERCRRYQIRLNPHKCIFCMRVGRLLGFIVSKEGIRVDPLKVEEIIQLSTPRNIRHLNILQRIANFLRTFMVNFSNLTKGFMHLLKNTHILFFLPDPHERTFSIEVRLQFQTPTLNLEVTRTFLQYVDIQLILG